MAKWKGIIGKSHTANSFDSYCHTLSWNAWRPSLIILHNTAIPSLDQRPNGFTEQHMKNLETYYRDTNRWSAGPHLFVDDKRIWVFTPLTVSGVHSPSYNKLALGVEMLGNYETESFSSGRGKKVRKNTVAAIATLSAILGIDPETMKLHREDTRTTHHCPGNNVVVQKLQLIQEVQELMVSRHGGDHAADEDPDDARPARHRATTRAKARSRKG